MAKDAPVSEDLARKFASEKETPYTRWVRAEGLDIVSSFYVPDLHAVELKPWARRGGRGVFLNHDASRSSNDCYVCEIPPGKELAPQRQLYEEMIYVLDGRGSTSVWNDAGKRTTFEWKAGAMFAIPLNTWHQHFNCSGTQPARYLAVRTDEEGMDVDQLEHLLKRHSTPKLLYTMPDFQNPTGVTLSLARRRRLIELANRFDLIVLEDTPYREIRFEGEPIPTLKSLDTEERVIYLGSFSKILAPGLRLGWTVASAELTQELGLLKLAADTQCSTLSMAATSLFLERFDVEAHLAVIRETYRRKKQAMI